MSSIKRHSRELNLDGRVILYDIDLSSFGGAVERVCPISNVLGNGQTAYVARNGAGQRSAQVDFQGLASDPANRVLAKIVFSLAPTTRAIEFAFGNGTEDFTFSLDHSDPSIPATKTSTVVGSATPITQNVVYGADNVVYGADNVVYTATTPDGTTTASMESHALIQQVAGGAPNVDNVVYGADNVVSGLSNVVYATPGLQAQGILVMSVPASAICDSFTMTLEDSSGNSVYVRSLEFWIEDPSGQIHRLDEVSGVDKIQAVTAPVTLADDQTLYYPVNWRGNSYTVMPIDASGFEARSEGQLPRPRLSMSNVLGVGTGWLNVYGDIAGATVTRWVTFQRFLDDGLYADPNSHLPIEEYTIDQKVSHNRQLIEWDMASILDQQGSLLPGRQVLRTGCQLLYRTRRDGAWDYTNVTCPYVGAPMFDDRDQPTADPTKDRCSQQLSGCLKRFSRNIPFGGFPSAGRIS